MIDILVLSIIFIIVLALYIFKDGVNFNKFIIFSFFVIVAIPKVNIIGGNSQVTTAGVRLDDFLLLILLVLTFIKYRGRLNGSINALIVLFSLFLLNGCFSAVYAYLRGESASLIMGLLTVIRYFEYFCFAIIASKIPNRASYKKIFMNSLRVLTVFLALIAILQHFYLANYYVGGKEAGSFFGGLAVATFNGYYEYGCFCVLLVYLFLSSERKVDYLFAAIAFSQVLLTESRTSLLVLAIVVVFFLFVKCFWCESLKAQRTYIAISATLLVGGVVFIIVASVNGLLDRFATLDPTSLLAQFSNEWANRDYDYYVYCIRNNIDIVINSTHSEDFSFNIRLFKWASALDGFLRYPFTGYGPAVTQTMDGSYIKLLCEQGIIGMTLWIVILFTMLNKINVKKNYMIGFVSILLLSAIAIDMFEASKIMEFIWFMGGMMLANNNILLTKEKKRCKTVEELTYARAEN